ncbi:L-rhamnose mutarotase [Variovorax sp. PAMC26660]|uniref:L-rhamnose mutarotase n=1 Tax=Variovorax sp. PAMC26660 TaxID=2762322 RepID=UPI00164EBFD6|nr:L-rhamnose mutarotase [Variovorax sp. PAMC26660]QNK65396.1 L-rhamnose mutarotase [Variovorax sp. PAMC26660]
MRHCLALDLKDDPKLIAEYEAYHRSIWPEVRAHLHVHGVTGMEIYRLGTRMVMLMETDDARYDAQAMALASQSDSKIGEWETLMWKFQAPTPWTPEGEKWVAMERIFAL